MQPRQASESFLPDGFSPMDIATEWLQAIEFGREEKERSEDAIEKREMMRKAGLPPGTSQEDMKEFRGLGVSLKELINSHKLSHPKATLAEQEVSNPARLTERVIERAKERPEREETTAERTVQPGQPESQRRAKEYLRGRYTNEDGIMFCQVCWRAVPFFDERGNPFLRCGSYWGKRY